MSSKKNHAKRTVTFFRSDLPLTSRRVSVILSNPSSSSKLARAVRVARHSQDKVTDKEEYFFEVEGSEQ